MPDDNFSGPTDHLSDDENRRVPNGNNGGNSGYLDMSKEGGAIGFSDLRKRAGAGPKITLEEFLAPGRKIRKGNFKIVKRIGKGGFGSVFLADHEVWETMRRLIITDAIEYGDLKITKDAVARGEQLGPEAFGALYKRMNSIHPCLVSPQVAIKVLDPSLIVGDKQDDPTNYVRRLRLEAGFMEHFNHPNVIKAIGIKGTSFWAEENPRTGEDIFYAFAMQYAPDSVSLDCIENLTSEETFNIMDQIFSGTWHTHDEGAVWRDAAPKNMLYKRTTGEAWCTDFGISRPMTTQKDIGITQDTGSGGDLSITTSGSILATPWFASPDQILQPKTVEPPSDNYSLAASWYRMVTGENPIGGSLSNPDGQKICSRVSSFDPDHAPRFPNQILKQEEAKIVVPGEFQRRQVSDEIEDIIMLLLDKDVQKRLGTRKRSHIEQKIEAIRKGNLFYKVHLTPETEKQALDEASRILAEARKEETAATGGDLAHMLNAAENYADAAAAMPRVLLEGSVSDFSREDAYAKSMELYQRVVTNFQVGAVGRPASKGDIEDSLHYVEAHKRLEHRRVDRLGLLKQARKREIDKLFTSAGTRPGISSPFKWLTWSGKVDKWARSKLDAAKEFMLQEKYVAARTQVNDVMQYFSQYDVGSSLAGIAHRLSVAISGTELQDQTPIEGLKSQYSTLEWLETMIGLMRKEVGRRNFKLVREKIDGTVKRSPQGQETREPGFRENLSDLEEKYKAMKAEARLDASDISIGKKVEDMFSRRRAKIRRIISELEEVNRVTEAEYHEFDKVFVFPLKRLEGSYNVYADTIADGGGVERAVFDEALAGLAEIENRLPEIKKEIISEKDCRGLEIRIAGFKERTKMLREKLARSTYASVENNLQQIGEYVKRMEHDKFQKEAEMCAMLLAQPISALESPLSIGNIDPKYLEPGQNLDELKRKMETQVPAAKKAAAEVKEIMDLRKKKESADPKEKARACIGLFFANLSTPGNLQQKLEHMKHAWRHYKDIDVSAATAGFDQLAFAAKRENPGFKPTADENLAMRVLGLKTVYNIYDMIIYGLSSPNNIGFKKRTPRGLDMEMVDSYSARLTSYNPYIIHHDTEKRKLFDASFDEELGQICGHVEGGDSTYDNIIKTRENLDKVTREQEEADQMIAALKAAEPDETALGKNSAYIKLKSERDEYHSQKIQLGSDLARLIGKVRMNSIQELESKGLFMPSDPNDYRLLADFFEQNDNPVLARYFTRQYSLTQEAGSSGIRESQTRLVTLDGRITRELGPDHIPRDPSEIADENGGAKPANPGNPGNPGEGYKGPGSKGAAPEGSAGGSSA